MVQIEFHECVADSINVTSYAILTPILLINFNSEHKIYIIIVSDQR